MREAALTRRIRLVLVGLLIAGFAAPATAAPRCQLLKDAKGDAGLNGGEGSIGGPVSGTYDSTLDIVSADLAADRTRLTVVIRVAGFPGAATPLPSGSSWSFHFASPESAFFLAADRTLAGSSFTLYHYTTPYSGDTSQSFLYERIAEVTGVVDTDAAEIRMTAPLALFAPYDAITTGATLQKLLVISWLEAEPTDGWSNGSQADETGGGGRATYRVGTRNCVRVGS